MTGSHMVDYVTNIVTLVVIKTSLHMCTYRHQDVTRDAVRINSIQIIFLIHYVCALVMHLGM